MKKKNPMKKFNALEDHRPGKGYGQWIGVEIECFMPYESLGIANDDDGNKWGLASKRLAARIRDARIPHVTVKSDGSISSPTRGSYFETEITILFTRGNKAPLRKLCSVLKELKTQVNKSCGLHVHLDCRDLAPKKSSQPRYDDPLPRELRRRGEKLENVLPLLMQMVSKSRRNNSYCAPRMSEQRSAINLGAFNKHRTIEVRLHQGSVNFEKIAQWVELLYRSSRARKDMDVKTVAQLRKYLARPPKSLTEYVQSRIASFDKSGKKKVKTKKRKEVASDALMTAAPVGTVMPVESASEIDDFDMPEFSGTVQNDGTIIHDEGPEPDFGDDSVPL